MDTPVKKYLHRYADIMCGELTDFPSDQFAHCLAIPCYDESVQFIERLTQTQFKAQGPILVCLVINQPIGANSEANSTLLKHLSAWPCLWRNQHLSLHLSPSAQQAWLVVDCTNPGLAPKSGVGLARKIAADLVCSLWQRGCLTTPWLHCTDADAHLPTDYFDELSNHSSAAVFAHSHRPDPRNPDLSHATALYEKAMAYYVAGLRWAGSPYGFSSIGSTLAVQLHAYCQVRGFPVRNAAEDFYLLNKLVKVAPLAYKNDIVVEIESRLSHRVPFGTGPAVAKIMALESPSEDYTYYAPTCFQSLKQWLDYLPHLATNVHRDAHPLRDLDDPAAGALKAIGIESIINHIHRQQLDPARSLKALHDWFDGFKTLKWLRFLQQHHYPAEPLLQSIARAPFAL